MKILGLSLFFVCVTAHSADWRPLIDADNIKVTVDASSVVLSGKYRKAWFNETSIPDDEGNSFTSYKPFKTTRSLVYFLCAERKTAFVENNYYAADGTFIGGSTFDVKRIRFSEVAPDTVGETMLTYTCARVIRSK